MANLKDELKDRQSITKEIQRLKQVMESHNETAKSYQQAQEKILKLEKELIAIRKQNDNFLKLEKNQTKEKKEQAAVGRKTLNIEKQLNKLKQTSQGSILKEVNLLKSIEKTSKAAQNTTGKTQKAFNLASQAQLQALEDIKNGTFDAGLFMENLGEEMEALGPQGKKVFNTLQTDLGDFIDIAKEGGESLSDALNIDAKDLDGLENAREKLKQFSAIASSPTLMGAAAIGLAVKLITDFASAALDVRQELGTSAVESGRIASNMKVAAFQAKLFGGNEEEARKAVTAINREFGSLDASSSNVSRLAGSITAQFGIGGENLAKLTKQMSSLNGESLETNINTLETVGNLARAARVAPADVLNDMAESTETFAKFADKGGESLAKAAIEARKLGLELKDVDAIAESLLDFEASIEKQMEASVLLGKQLNLERARELSLSGDLDGVLAEVVKQVGSAEEISKMNVVQRKALADAVGLEVGQLTKLAAGQKAVTDESEKTAGSMVKFVVAGAAAGAVVGLIGGALVSIIPGIIASTGIGATIAGAMQKQGLKTLGKGAAMGGAVGALAGGVIGGASTKAKGLLPANTTKMAEGGVLVGEAGVEAVLPLPAAGIKTDMTESNTLLRQLISQNEVLMNRLTSKVNDLALSS